MKTKIIHKIRKHFVDAEYISEIQLKRSSIPHLTVAKIIINSQQANYFPFNR